MTAVYSKSMRGYVIECSHCKKRRKYKVTYDEMAQIKTCCSCDKVIERIE